MRNNFQSSPVNEMNNPKVTAATPAHSRTDEDLVAAAKRGDELALETLIKRYRPRIFAVALRYAGVHEDAEDIVQQTFQKVFVYLHNFQGKSSFSTWVTRIGINESLMLLRKSRGSREVSIEGSCSEDATSPGREIFNSSPNPEMSYLQREAGQILFSAIAQLKPKLRVVLELKELRELSGYDTARHIGVSLSAVKARVFHGRKKLRKLLRGSLRAPRVSGSSVSAIAANVKRMPQDRITRSA